MFKSFLPGLLILFLISTQTIHPTTLSQQMQLRVAEPYLDPLLWTDSAQNFDESSEYTQLTDDDVMLSKRLSQLWREAILISYKPTTAIIMGMGAVAPVVAIAITTGASSCIISNGAYIPVEDDLQSTITHQCDTIIYDSDQISIYTELPNHSNRCF